MSFWSQLESLERMLQNEVLLMVVAYGERPTDDTLAWFNQLQREEADGD